MVFPKNFVNGREIEGQDSLTSAQITTLAILQNAIISEASGTQVPDATLQNGGALVDFEASFEDALQLAYRGHEQSNYYQSAETYYPDFQLPQGDFHNTGGADALPMEIADAALGLEVEAGGLQLDVPDSVSQIVNDIINFEEQHNNATETEPGTSNSRPRQETEAELSEFLVVRSSATSGRADSGDEFENAADLSPKSTQSKKGKAGGKGRVVKRTRNVGNSVCSNSDPVVKAKPSTSGLQKNKKAKADIKNIQNSELFRMLQPVGETPAKQNAKPKGGRKKRVVPQTVENTALPTPRPQAVQEVALQPGTVNATSSQPEAEEGDYEILNVFSQDDERSTVKDFLLLARQTKRDEEDRRRKLEDAAVELRARRAERDREVAARQRLLDELRLVEARIRAKEEEIQQVEERVRSRRIDLDRATQKLACIGEILNRLESR